MISSPPNTALHLARKTGLSTPLDKAVSSAFPRRPLAPFKIDAIRGAEAEAAAFGCPAPLFALA